MNGLQRKIDGLERQVRKEKNPERLADLRERIAIAKKQLEKQVKGNDRVLVLEQEEGWLSKFMKWGK